MNPQVTTLYGRLEGSVSDDGAVLRFKGIPYAAPPVGALRWRPPQRPDAWEGVRPARSFGPACIQPLIPEQSILNGGEGAMSEDCLTLNIYTASTDAAEKRPVIVWLHHGGFMMGWSGSPLYDGGALARAGAVVVTVNYRLGRLGFLAHPGLSAESPAGSSGNYGLMDQIAALHWVRDNIGAFGGDPDCVTIYGVSAGCYSASALMASPLARGLFHRAIGSSGGAFGPVATSSEAGDCLMSLDAAEALGAQVMAGVGADTVEAMRALSPETILGAREAPFHLAPRGLLDTTYPILDGDVLPIDPYSVFSSSTHNDVPLITGSNREESAFSPFNGDTTRYLADSRAFFGPFFDRFIALFPAGVENRTAYSSMAANSDRLFSWQNWTWARLQAANGRKPVFYYNFVHAPPVPPQRYLEQHLNPDLGAFHTGEIPYVWRNLDRLDWHWSEADRALSEALSGYWVDFARSGDPNGGGRPLWPAFDTAGQAMMRFAETPQPGVAAPSARFAFWDDFYAWLKAEQAA